MSMSQTSPIPSLSVSSWPEFYKMHQLKAEFGKAFKKLTGTLGQLSCLQSGLEHFKSMSGHPSKSLSVPHLKPSPAKPTLHLHPKRLPPKGRQFAFLSQIVMPSAHMPGVRTHPFVEFDFTYPVMHSQSYDPSMFLQFMLAPHRAVFSWHSSMSSHRWRWKVWSMTAAMKSPWECWPRYPSGQGAHWKPGDKLVQRTLESHGCNE